MFSVIAATNKFQILHC